MFTYAYMTNEGNREINEDSVLALENGEAGCFVVADGLGGHDLGEVASRLAVETFFDAFSERESYGFAQADIAEFMETTFSKAQERILKEQQIRHMPETMKTTCVALLLIGNRVVWGHVGDSRLYAFRKNKISERTLDHSVPQMLVMAGDIKEKQIRNHPDRNRLLRVMGIPWERKKQDISDVKNADDYQAFLLCSDGFWEFIEEKTMCKLLKKSKDVDEWLSAMQSEVEKNGMSKNMDNYTAVAVWC